MRRQVARRLGVLVGTAALVALAACGGGGGVDTSTDAISGFTGFRRFESGAVNGAGVAGRLQVDLNDLGSRALRPDEVIVLLTSSDGLFNRTAVEVTSLTGNRIEGMVTADDEAETVYDVLILLTADGRALTVRLTRRSDGAVVQATAEVVSTGGAADPALLAAATALYGELLSEIGGGELPLRRQAEEEPDIELLHAVYDAYAAALASGPNDPRANLGYGMFAALLALAEAGEMIPVDGPEVRQLRRQAGGGLLSGGRQDEEDNPIDLPDEGEIIDEILFAGPLAWDEMAIAQAVIFMATQWHPIGTQLLLDLGLSTAFGQLIAPLTNKEPFTILYDAGLYFGDEDDFEDLERSRQDEGDDEEFDIDRQLLIDLVREHALPGILIARQAFERAVAAGDFRYVVPFATEDGEDELVFGPTEAQLLAGNANVIEGMLTFPLVWQWAMADYDVPTLTDAELADGVLTPAEYLFDPPYGLLAPDGRRNATSALAAMRRGYRLLGEGWAGVTDSGLAFGIEVIPGLAPARHITTEIPSDMTMALEEFSRMVEGVYVIDYPFLSALTHGSFSFELALLVPRFNIPGFWSNPPADARTMLPTFELVDDQLNLYGVGSVGDVTKGSWPLDANGRYTFGGLITPGLRQDHLRQMFVLDFFVTESDSPGQWYIDTMDFFRRR